MRNRAKCRLCNSIIESYHQYDYVECKCGEISVDGGAALYCYAKDFANFLRVDDEGNEIVMKIVETDKPEAIHVDETAPRPTKDDMLRMLDDMIASYERLPEHAMHSPVTNADHLALLLLLSSILKA